MKIRWWIILIAAAVAGLTAGSGLAYEELASKGCANLNYSSIMNVGVAGLGGFIGAVLCIILGLWLALFQLHKIPQRTRNTTAAIGRLLGSRDPWEERFSQETRDTFKLILVLLAFLGAVIGLVYATGWLAWVIIC